MSVALDAIDRLIDDTLVKVKEVPNLEDKYLVNNAIGLRLSILQEAKSEVLKAETKRLEDEINRIKRPPMKILPGEDPDDYK